MAGKAGSEDCNGRVPHAAPREKVPRLPSRQSEMCSAGSPLLCPGTVSGAAVWGIAIQEFVGERQRRMRRIRGKC